MFSCIFHISNLRHVGFFVLLTLTWLLRLLTLTYFGTYVTAAQKKNE